MSYCAESIFKNLQKFESIRENAGFKRQTRESKDRQGKQRKAVPEFYRCLYKLKSKIKWNHQETGQKKRSQKGR
jgi:hypothetical protein